MTTPPVIIHAPTSGGGRLVTVHIRGRGQRLGMAHSDFDVVVFLAAAGLADPELALDNPAVVEWQGAGPHEYKAD
ncbi:hypothetical protein [Streptomyces sp. NPDC002346]